LQLVAKEKRTKRYFVHFAVLTVVLFVVIVNQVSAFKDEGSILFALFGDDKLYTDKTLAMPYGKISSHLASYLTAVNTAYAEGAESTSQELTTSQENVLIRLSSPLTSETASSDAKRKEIVEYTVVAGDTPSTIAAEFGVSTNTVLWENDLRKDEIIKPGDTLKILPVTGVEHRVKEGDTIEKIAKKYDADAEEIKKFNGIEDRTLKAGEEIIVPDGYISVPVSVPEPPPQKVAQEESEEITPFSSSEVVTSGEFVWPTTTKHISQYFRWGHTGIDIDNRSRPPIFAAEEGTVVFAGWRSGYGRTVIISHGNGLQTLYGHADQLYVKSGQKVNKGQAIAKMGSTGWSTGPHVHFEVIKNGVKKNPLSYF